MSDKNILATKCLLDDTGISLLDAARLVRNILDARSKSSKFTPIEFCHKVIETGKRNLRTKEMSFSEGLALYIESKSHLRFDSIRDIKYLLNRLKKSHHDFSTRNFSELSSSDCETWLIQAFNTPSQFNKARAILHGLFEFAIRREWCDRNPIKLIERKKIIEKEIKPLSISETRRIIKTAQISKYKNCLYAVAILMFAGIRPREVRRLKWSDIDLSENSITVRSQCSKTGGVRCVEICPNLKLLLESAKGEKSNSPICPPNWNQHWKKIRDDSGFKGLWIQDVLRHTYASFHAKYFRNLQQLQINMGHRDTSLLQARYVNMRGISSSDAKAFFQKLN